MTIGSSRNVRHKGPSQTIGNGALPSGSSHR